MFLMRETSGKVVVRTRLIERLNEGLSAGRTPGLTLISAPAGFGKSTPCNCIPHNTLIIQTVGPYMLFSCENIPYWQFL
jgi:hypothetical protein